MNGPIGDALVKARYPEIARDMLYVAIQGVYSECEGNEQEVLAHVMRVARQVAKDMRGGQNLRAERPGLNCQPRSGADRATAAEGGRVETVRSAPAFPSRSQINATLQAKLSSARSMFATFQWCGKPIGEWSYHGIAAVRRDGKLAQALLDEIGVVPEADKTRNLSQLLGGSEQRLRKVLKANGYLKEV